LKADFWSKGSQVKKRPDAIPTHTKLWFNDLWVQHPLTGAQLQIVGYYWSGSERRRIFLYLGGGAELCLKDLQLVERQNLDTWFPAQFQVFDQIEAKAPSRVY